MSEKKLARFVENYRKLRDKKKQIEEENKAKLEPINVMMAKVEAEFLNMLNEMGADSVKTAAGTVYKSEKWTASVADWDTVLEHIRENELWHLLNRSVSMTAARAEAETGNPVPGVNLSSFATVNVRKPEPKGS